MPDLIRIDPDTLERMMFSTEQLNQIGVLQSYLVREAEEHKIPLIFSADIEGTLDDILMYISNTIVRHFLTNS